jgi:hypothetical protein
VPVIPPHFTRYFAYVLQYVPQYYPLRYRFRLSCGLLRAHSSAHALSRVETRTNVPKLETFLLTNFHDCSLISVKRVYIDIEVLST